ncbi:MAG: hypothetical protein P8Y96_01145 [Desulfuromonadales bacterium]|jgi:hypothetical protein
MDLHIDVELKDGSVCRMARHAFNVFLSLDKVARFRRSDGWVDVSSEPLRDPETGSSYPPHADRRQDL